jgi:photosystem II stability/assembly factor-like uncharacterized protein
VRRPPIALLASLVLVGALVTGCDDDSSDRVAPPTSRTGGAEGATTSTLPAPGHFVGAWSAGAEDLWGLTSEPCPRPDSDKSRCAVVSRTTDAGETWTRLARVDVGTTNDGATDSVTAVHFADAQHGWVYNRNLFATFNGGRRWQPVDLGNPVVALESAGGTAFALVGSCGYGVGNCNAPMRVYEGTVSTGRWRFLTLGFELPPTDVGSLVVGRSAVYAVIVRGLEQTFLARTGGGRWERRTLPCPRALVAPIQSQEGLVAACRPPAPSGPVELQTSSDGGRTWAVVWQHTFPSAVSSLAVAGPATVIGLENGDVIRSGDDGMNFARVLRVGSAPTFRFTDAERGSLLAGSPGERQLYRTSDGGATWRPVAPPD